MSISYLRSDLTVFKNIVSTCIEFCLVKKLQNYKHPWGPPNTPTPSVAYLANDENI